MDTSDLLPSQRMIPICQSILTSWGAALLPGARVLDFGCGSGRHVREFRAAGFDAVGIDRNLPEATPGDAASEENHLYTSSPEGAFPFESNSFDFCFSTSVVEHVIDYDQPFSEIARVLKPGAHTLHVFPARGRLVEPHMGTPLGGRLQHRGLLWLWALLGVRNSYQKGLSPRDTVARNREYCATGIRYPTRRTIEEALRRHFQTVEFAEREFVAATKDASRGSRLVSRVIGFPGAEGAYRTLHTVVALARTAGS